MTLLIDRSNPGGGGDSNAQRPRPLTKWLLLSVALLCLAGLSCTKPQTPSLKRYLLTGRVVSIEPQTQSAVIDATAIPGFMDAMAMSYKIEAATEFKQLSSGDTISAQLVVAQDQDRNSDQPAYWLENVKVTGHSIPASSPSRATAQYVPAPGDEVPDFQLTNQSGKRIALKQFRGKVLFITFIYTRCPFPDYCPRVMHNFSQLNQQVAADPVLSAKVHLLSISFDPAYDTPRVLRDYAFSQAHTTQPALFDRWEFAVPRAADLPRIADYFALTYKPESGLITHSLSTAVIGPDGKIAKWYHGSEWQASDLIKDASDTLRAPGTETVSVSNHPTQEGRN